MFDVFVSNHGMQSVSDLANFWTRAQCGETVMLEVMDKFTLQEGKRIQAARLRTAWHIAAAEVAGAVARRGAVDNETVDWDAPLDPDVQADQENFRAAHNLELEPEAFHTAAHQS